MSTQTLGPQVRWQDLRMRSEIELVLEIAKQQGWDDCEVFGSGDMITQPQDSMCGCEPYRLRKGSWA